MVSFQVKIFLVIFWELHVWQPFISCQSSHNRTCHLLLIAPPTPPTHPLTTNPTCLMSPSLIIFSHFTLRNAEEQAKYVSFLSCGLDQILDSDHLPIIKIIVIVYFFNYHKDHYIQDVATFSAPPSSSYCCGFCSSSWETSGFRDEINYVLKQFCSTYYCKTDLWRT